MNKFVYLCLPQHHWLFRQLSLTKRILLVNIVTFIHMLSRPLVSYSRITLCQLLFNYRAIKVQIFKVVTHVGAGLPKTFETNDIIYREEKLFRGPASFANKGFKSPWEYNNKIHACQNYRIKPDEIFVYFKTLFQTHAVIIWGAVNSTSIVTLYKLYHYIFQYFSFSVLRYCSSSFCLFVLIAGGHFLPGWRNVMNVITEWRSLRWIECENKMTHTPFTISSKQIST